MFWATGEVYTTVSLSAAALLDGDVAAEAAGFSDGETAAAAGFDGATLATDELAGGEVDAAAPPQAAKAALAPATQATRKKSLRVIARHHTTGRRCRF
jgi:hypothetical protein